MRGNEREKTGTGKKLERTRFFPFPFLQILTSAHLYPTYVPISAQYAEWMEGPRPLSRTQIPLRLSWAFTIYKSQGQTIRKAMIHLGNREQQSGATFVALSRLRRLEDGVVEQFPFEHLEAMRRHRNLQARRREEARLQALAQITLRSLYAVDDGAGPSS